MGSFAGCRLVEDFFFKFFCTSVLKRDLYLHEKLSALSQAVLRCYRNAKCLLVLCPNPQNYTNITLVMAALSFGTLP